MKELIDDLVVPARAAVAELFVRSGLLAALREAPGTAEEVARRLGFDARATARCLAAAAALELCVRDADDRFAAATPALPWSGLDRFLRTGALAVDLDDRPTRESLYTQVVDQLGDRFEGQARALASRLPIVGSILDVGAGAGAWSLAMAARDPATTVTAFDLPPVLPRFVANAARWELSPRVHTVAGSWNDQPLPRGFDRVVLAAVLHLEDVAGARALTQAACTALAPGGDLVVIDVFPDRVPEPIVSVYALHLALRLRKGGVHRSDVVLDACAQAGLVHHEWIQPDGESAPMALRVW